MTTKYNCERAAVHGLASLAANLKKDNPSWNDPKVVAVLIDTSKSDNADLRSDSRICAGNFGRSKANARLTQMLDDEHADARYNAGVGLARIGDAAACR